jgi:hypothetical protein
MSPWVPPPPVPKLATSTADMKAGPGGVVAAVIAPKTGAIDHPEGTPVVVVVQSFWNSKTMTWLRRTVYAAFAGAFVVAFGPAVLAGNLSGVDWTNVLDTFEKAFLYTVIAAVFGVMKKYDNDPVK